jgi:hypothetical protein
MPVALEEPPARFAAGADAVETFEAKARTLLAQAQAHANCPRVLRTNNADHKAVDEAIGHARARES